MAQTEAVPSGCCTLCPHYTLVQGSCNHGFRQLLINYIENNPDAPCPVYDEFRAREMADLAQRMR